MSHCYFPRVIHNPNYQTIVPNDELPMLVVPCGKCFACLSTRRQLWLFRLKQESLSSYITFFTTLTMNDDNLHDVCKSDLQLLFKRLRHYMNFRYYAIGEYGTNTHRPHYHVVFFVGVAAPCNDFERLNARAEFASLLQDQWPFGNIQVSVANTKRLNYITHYHIRPKVVDGKSTFQLFSKGLGSSLLEDPATLERVRHNSTNEITDYEGFTINLPRYYRKKFDIPSKPVEIQKEMETLQQGAARMNVDFFQYLQDMKDADTHKFTKYNLQEKF